MDHPGQPDVGAVLRLPGDFLNAVRADRFSDAEASALSDLALSEPAARVALAAHHRARSQVEQLERLGPDVVLPFVALAEGGVDLGALASVLDSELD